MSAEEEEMSLPTIPLVEEGRETEFVIPSTVTGDDEISKSNSISQILTIWEKRKRIDADGRELENEHDSTSTHGLNPVPILTRLSEILEYERLEYLKLDRDPYEERNLFTTEVDCGLVKCWKEINKNKIFCFNLTYLYSSEIWGEQLDLPINTAACRLMVNLLPEFIKITDFLEGSISFPLKLLKWAEFGPEPLQSYALSLLAVAMKNPDIATQFSDENSHLMAITLQRLEQLQQQFLKSAHTSQKSSGSNGTQMEPSSRKCWQVFPANLTSSQISAIRYINSVTKKKDKLSTVEYEESLSQKKIEILIRYLSIPFESLRLTFEVLLYLAKLLDEKKFALHFLSVGGLQSLLGVPRESFTATGVAICLSEVTGTRAPRQSISLMSNEIFQELINYGKWLIGCSHITARNYALWFLCGIYYIKTALNLFDSQDGLRSVQNVLSRNRNFVLVTPDPLPRRDHPQQNIMDPTADDIVSVKNVSLNFIVYFENHLRFARPATNTRTHNSTKIYNTPNWSSLTPIFIDLPHIDLPSLELVVEKFVNQRGLQAIFAALDLTGQHNDACIFEIQKNMLDVLAICCLVTNAKIKLIEPILDPWIGHMHNALHFIFDLTERGDLGVRKTALKVIIFCMNDPFETDKPSEEQIKIWESARKNDGIQILVRLLLTKTPIMDADGIRALACWCLAGLARYEPVRQVLQHLPLIRLGVLQELMKKPISQRRLQGHAIFREHGLKIIKLVTGEDEDSSIVKTTGMISYDKKQLMKLVHDYLSSEGLLETADKLKEELQTKSVQLPPSPSNTTQVSLDKIVKKYLHDQHTQCKTPMAKFPKFDLFCEHKCPNRMDSVRSTLSQDATNAQTNFATRMMKREVFGCAPGLNDKRLIYSHYSPNGMLANRGRVRYASCIFANANPNDPTRVITGMSDGDIHIYNNSNLDEASTYSCHGSETYHLQTNSKGDLLLTSTHWRDGISSALWKIQDGLESLIYFPTEDYAEFNKRGQDKVLSTETNLANVYDINTKTKILSLQSRTSNHYLDNRATFDQDDNLILSDGILWDFKSAKAVHQFTKLNEFTSGIFNPRNGNEIISNADIWDVRTMRLLKTVDLLDQCRVYFTNDHNIIYAHKVHYRNARRNAILSESSNQSFVVIDNSADYSTIATIKLKRHILDMAVSPDDLQLILVENHSINDRRQPQSFIRFYDIGIPNPHDEYSEDNKDNTLTLDSDDANVVYTYSDNNDSND